MFPKQVTPFIVSHQHIPTAEALADKLAQAAFAPVTGLEWFSEGFTAPAPFSRDFVFSAEDSHLIRLQRQEKILPSGAIKEVLDERVAKIEQEEVRSVGRKEKQELKEQIIDDLLPRAITQSISRFAVITPQYLFCHTGSQNQAENMLFKLREALGGLDARLAQTNRPLRSLMTNWLLKGECEGDFELGDECKLQGTGDVPAVVKISRKNLTDVEVMTHVQNGMFATELELVWRERLVFVLTENFNLRKIAWLDSVMQEAEDVDDDTSESVLFASQLIACNALTQVVDELSELCGGFLEN